MSKVLNSDFRGNPNLNWIKKDIKILKLRVKNSDNQNYKYAYIFFGIFKCYEKFKHTGEVVEEEGWGRTILLPGSPVYLFPYLWAI